MNGNPFGPGTCEYGFVGLLFDKSASFLIGAFVVTVPAAAASFGMMLMADENVVRLTSEFAAVRAPIFFANL